MTKRKPKQDNYDYDVPEQYLMIGAYGGYQSSPKDDRKIRPQIGFVRQKVKAAMRKRK